jgi:hypothetical protein
MPSMELVTRDVLEGLAIPFGSPSKRDLQGEFFTPSTDFHYDGFRKMAGPRCTTTGSIRMSPARPSAGRYRTRCATMAYGSRCSSPSGRSGSS